MKATEGGSLTMLTFVGIASSALYLVLLPAILVFGLIQCKKHSFKGGFYFFLFLLIGKIYSFLFSYAFSPKFKMYIDSLDHETARPLGMRTGDLLTWIAYVNNSITFILEIVAFSFLIVGLYRMWNKNDQILRSPPS
jgi:hypothetical protein